MNLQKVTGGLIRKEGVKVWTFQTFLSTFPDVILVSAMGAVARLPELVLKGSELAATVSRKRKRKSQ